jgi:VIT1/CCC1 family predicted Fe2+/Mn2+ transporter
MKKYFDIYMLALGGLIVAGFFTILALLLFIDIKPGNESLLNIAIGGLMANFGAVVGYFFGSSHGSRIKTDMTQNIKKDEE